MLTVVDVPDAELWIKRLAAIAPELEFALPEATAGREYEVTVAIVGGSATGLNKYVNLGLVQSLWAGVDGLALDPALPGGAKLARLIDPNLTQAMVEFVLTAVLYVHRQLPTYLSQERDRTWGPLVQAVASEKRVAILGAGELGSAVAQALAAVGFKTACWARTPRPAQINASQGQFEVVAGADDLKVLLAESDFVVNLLPLTEATKGLLNSDFFGQCKAGSCLINAGRGASVVDDDLLAALENGRVGFAILDVFHVEPLPKTHPYWSNPRVLVLPHIAASSEADSVAASLVNAVRAYQSGGAIAGLVDVSRGY